MCRSLQALILVLNIGSTAFAAWNVECMGPQGSTLMFSETSFSGEPFLIVRSSNFSINLHGRQQILISRSIDGKRHVSATQHLNQHIQFGIPVDLLPDRMPGENVSFDIVVSLEKSQLKEELPMYCKATSVVFV